MDLLKTHTTTILSFIIIHNAHPRLPPMGQQSIDILEVFLVVVSPFDRIFSGLVLGFAGDGRQLETPEFRLADGAIQQMLEFRRPRGSR